MGPVCDHKIATSAKMPPSPSCLVPLPPRPGFCLYQVRSDPNLKEARASERFKQIIDKFDEPFINENAFKAVSSLFSFGKKN